jgi:hypothetical protein
MAQTRRQRQIDNTWQCYTLHLVFSNIAVTLLLQSQLCPFTDEPVGMQLVALSLVPGSWMQALYRAGIKSTPKSGGRLYAKLVRNSCKYKEQL